MKRRGARPHMVGHETLNGWLFVLLVSCWLYWLYLVIFGYWLIWVIYGYIGSYRFLFVGLYG